MKKFLSAMLCVVMIFTATACGNSTDSGASSADSSASDSSAVADVSSTESSNDKESVTDASSDAETNLPDVEGGFKVDGTKLVDANGNEFVMRGINHAHTWFRENLTEALDGIQATGSNTVRVVMSDGDQWDRLPLSDVKRVIEECKKRKMIAVLEVHDTTGKDDTKFLMNAVDYWIEVKDAFIGNEAYAILNIANEWYGSWQNGEKWRDAYMTAIPKLREAGIKNTIMVDSAGWGQNPQGSTLKFANEILNADPDKNTVFSVHMYGAAGKNERTVKSILDKALEMNICLIVGEFGYNHSDGDVDEATIMSYCTEKNMGYIGWSWKGNGGGVEYLDISRDWAGTDLSPDWGKNLVNGEFGIKNTSKLCSVFEG